jgi:hypothetical protein
LAVNIPFSGTLATNIITISSENEKLSVKESKFTHNYPTVIEERLALPVASLITV